MITGEIKKRMIRLKVKSNKRFKNYALVFFAIPINKLPLPNKAEILKKEFLQKRIFSHLSPD